jgi:hypothetical protein
MEEDPLVTEPWDHSEEGDAGQDGDERDDVEHRVSPEWPGVWVDVDGSAWGAPA